MVYNGVWDKAPRRWGVFEHFCVKSNLTACNFSSKLQSYRKKWGGQDVLLAPAPPTPFPCICISLPCISLPRN